MKLKNKAKAITLKHFKAGTRPFLCILLSAMMLISSFAIVLTGFTVYAAAKAPSGAAAALTIGETADGNFDAVISLQHCTDFTEGRLAVEYDTAALELIPLNTESGSVPWEILDDAKAFTDAGNTFSVTGDAAEKPGSIKLAFNLIEPLDAEVWGVDVDMADVKLFRMIFKALETSDTELTFTGVLRFVDGSEVTVNEKVYIEGKGAPEETTTEAPEETTTEAPEETTQHTHLYRQIVTLAPDCVNTGECEFICDCGEICRCILPATGHNDNNADGICDGCGKETDDKTEDNESFLDKIKAFFEKLAEFFRNLFTKA